MHPLQTETFNAFRRSVIARVVPYLEQLGIRTQPEFSEGSQWISARLRWRDVTLTLNVSLHHLDYQDGICVYVKTKFGQKELRTEARRNSSHEVPVYGYGVPEMNAQFDRIIKDMKLHFEKYMLV